eukprot:m.243986 g.243986  ORF g.243986 m.243986 type:complete len:405 (+) comp29141_c0_seq1:25-1239(+)
MASSPEKTQTAAACAPQRPAQEPTLKHQNLCEDCKEREGTLYCSKCELAFCVECDAAVHVRALKNHERMPSAERPLVCVIHNKETTAFCELENRLVCVACTCALPMGQCFEHIAFVKSLSAAEPIMRTRLEQLKKEFDKCEESFTREISALESFQAILVERKASLTSALTQTHTIQQSLTQACALKPENFLKSISETLARVEAMHAVLVAAIGDQPGWLEAFNVKTKTVAAHQPQPIPQLSQVQSPSKDPARGPAPATAASAPPLPLLQLLSPPPPPTAEDMRQPSKLECARQKVREKVDRNGNPRYQQPRVVKLMKTHEGRFGFKIWGLGRLNDNADEGYIVKDQNPDVVRCIEGQLHVKDRIFFVNDHDLEDAMSQTEVASLVSNSPLPLCLVVASPVRQEK